MSYYLRPSLITLSSSSYSNGAPLILSDHGRTPLSVSSERIEYRERMANGRMRSKFIADKRTFSTSWEMLPSRSTVSGVKVVADGYASATDLQRFYEAATGQIALSLYADTGSGSTLIPDALFDSCNVFFSSFSSELTKRGKDFDLYNVTMSLEES
jgi:hypothetical protein